MQCPNEDVTLNSEQGQPYKIMDYTKKHRFGVVASTLRELIQKACTKLNISPETPIRVALEQDGTEVEDEDYFSTLERNTALMILINDQKWLPPGKCPK